jgi:hypothetical protein
VQEDNMSFEMLNVIVTVIVILTTILTTITVFNYQVIFAPFDDDNDRSILPNYQEGYEVGKVQGSKDNKSSNEHNDRCPPDDHDILWCIGYEIGYNDGYYDNSEISDRNG